MIIDSVRYFFISLSGKHVYRWNDVFKMALQFPLLLIRRLQLLPESNFTLRILAFMTGVSSEQVGHLSGWRGGRVWPARLCYRPYSISIQGKSTNLDIIKLKPEPG